MATRGTGARGGWGVNGRKRAALYLRVSTDQQTSENEELELRPIAECRGGILIHVYTDNGGTRG